MPLPHAVRKGPILEDSSDPEESEPAAGVSISWPALVEAVSKTKITLATALERAKGEAAGGGYRISFAKPFDLDMAKRAAPTLEAALMKLSGRPMALELVLGAAEAAPVSDIVDHSMPEPKTGVDAPPGTRWKDVGEGAPEAGGAFGGLRNAEGVFGGKARIVKKPLT